MLNHGATLIIPALWADRMGGDCGAALRAVAYLTTLDMVVGTSLAASAVGVFSLRDSHRCKSKVI